jgi:mannose-6-phosphate isomerase-like protein (cupin superfamily)
MKPDLTASVFQRPWGGFCVLEEGEGYKIKRIWVHPGEILSLQSHEHRDEHWVVVKGAAEVTLGEKIIRLEKNQSVFIPRKAKHRTANPGLDTMEFVEVQVGNYLGEDDIVRYEDKYGRYERK